MDKETRSAIEATTQKARRLLEADFQEQLDGVFDVRLSSPLPSEPGRHLEVGQRRVWRKILTAIGHKAAGGMATDAAITDYVRDAAFTFLNRIVALKMLEARDLVLTCVSQGEGSSGFAEFSGLAPGVRTPDGAGYRLYLECLFDELSTEVKVLFDRRDAASALWPRRPSFAALLDMLNAPTLAGVWREDETIGWVYQYFNGQDERRKIRDESQVPRNSRELAVRNQFFTPRYVVQFLTDNTLGRIWYEMRDGGSALAEQCEYMVRRSGETWAPRAKKDPRDLRVLDPACGSGHFLLYAFDLLLTTYQEAWADPASPVSEVTGTTLRADYPDQNALRLGLPGMILAHNLHGVDIDPRCAQIAQLALWMRAQRAFREFDIDRAARPLIRRSNIVIAEPMPGETDLRDEFLRELNQDRLEGLMRRALDIPREMPVRTTKTMANSLAALVETVWESMELAGELGVLLKVERALGGAIERGRREWEEQLPLFRIAEYSLIEDRPGPIGREDVNFESGNGLDFWNKAERLVFQALQEYADAARGAGFARRRLFADDAVHGFALIDLVSKKFDIVLMNPPFGPATEGAADRLEPQDASNQYAAFVRRAKEFGATAVGCISDRTFMVQPTFTAFREHLLSDLPSLSLVADLGWGVLDANVQVAAFVLNTHEPSDDIAFVDLRNSESKAIDIAAAAPGWTWVSASVFSKLPDSILSYSLPRPILAGVDEWPSLSSIATLPRGLGSNKAARTYLTWYEVRTNSLAPGGRWESLANGGDFSPYWRQDLGIADWRGPNGRPWVAMNSADAWRLYDQSGTEFYFRRGLSFPKQSSSFHVSVLPEQLVPTREGKAILFNEDADIFPMMGLLNSGPVRAFVRDTCGLHKQSGAIGRIPIPPLRNADRDRLGELVQLVTSEVRKSYEADETSRNYIAPARFLRTDQDAATRIGDWVCEIEGLSRSAYGMAVGLETWLEPPASPIPFRPADTDTLSWSVGVAFGRFDIRLATGERPLPSESSPFEPRHAYSPAMLPDGDKPFQPCTGVLVDDSGHTDDLVARVTAVYQRVGEPIPSPDDLRRTLARDFFPAHIRMYSKSRRKAPIYWQLATQSASYAVWLYIQDLSKDTLFRVQNDYVGLKLAHERRQLEGLRAEAGPAPNTAQSRAIETQAALVEELSAMLDEVRRVAPLWNPDLDDGVILNFAPLWRLVPQNRAWQKELRSAWTDLVAGSCDWANLSMRLWPERVVPKCAKDRSLAIAHNLEDVFWFEDADGKWKSRPTPTKPLDEVIAERTSTAVKAALASLLEAPEPASGGRRRGRMAS